MNTRENNEKNLKKLEEAGVIFEDERIPELNGEDGEDAEIDEETGEKIIRESPFAFAKKASIAVFLIFWLGAVVMAFAGGDFRTMLPFMLFSIAAMALVNVPNFYIKKKYFDMIVALFAGVLLLVIGVTMLVMD